VAPLLGPEHALVDLQHGLLRRSARERHDAQRIAPLAPRARQQRTPGAREFIAH
jgi:hypothetical protein